MGSSTQAISGKQRETRISTESGRTIEIDQLWARFTIGIVNQRKIKRYWKVWENER